LTLTALRPLTGACLTTGTSPFDVTQPTVKMSDGNGRA
jgi:hypothetical protein